MKFWKNWPYWLKGGAIGIAIILISNALSISCLYFLAAPNSWGFECLPFALPSIPIVFLLLKFPDTYSLSSAVIIIIEVIIYFIVSSLIGLLVGYLKPKKILN